MVGRLARTGGAGARVLGQLGVAAEQQVRREMHNRPVRQDQRSERKRGRGEQVRAVQEHDRRDGEERQQAHGRQAEPVQRATLFRGEEDDEDRDGDEEDDEVEHGGWWGVGE